MEDGKRPPSSARKRSLSTTPRSGRERTPPPTSPTSREASPLTVDEEPDPRSSAPLLTDDTVIGTPPTDNRVGLFSQASGSSQGSHIMPNTLAKVKDQRKISALRNAGSHIMPNTLAKVEDKRKISALRNAGVSKSKRVKKAEVQKNTFSSAYVDDLVGDTQWDILEAYLKQFIHSSKPVEIHPMLFMRIRMSRVIDLIEKKEFSAADNYYQEHMRVTFQEIIGQGQAAHRNASVDDLSDCLKHVDKCLAALKSLPHIYTTNIMTKTVVNDYMRLYLAKEIGHMLPGKKDALWVFGLPLPPNSSSRPTFRCLACSVKVFSSGTIGDIAAHLPVCPRMNTPYLRELLEHCNNLKKFNATQPVIENPPPGEKAAFKRSNTDSEKRSAPSISADKQDILAKILVEMDSAEDLHREMEVDVGGVIELHKTMTERVTAIVNKHGKMGNILKKLRGLACHGSYVPSVPAAVLASTDSAATQEEKGRRDESHGQVMGAKDRNDDNLPFDCEHLAEQLSQEMQMNPPEPQLDLMTDQELADSFMDTDWLF